MRVFIPEIGTVLTLAAPWEFKLINENRNAGIAKLLGANGDYYYPWGTTETNEWANTYNRQRKPNDPGSYAFPAGTNLEVDRIYVRKGNEEFSSVTFKTHVGNKVLRFFAKLDDVNRIEI